MAENIQLSNVLHELGFVYMNEKLVYGFDNGQLNAYPIFDFKNGDCYLFYGTFLNSRTGVEIEFILQKEIDSFELAVALLAYQLHRYELKPRPDWFEQGLLWSHHLPWENVRLEWQNKPKTILPKDDFKFILKKLKALGETATPDQIAELKFDGKIFSATCDNVFIAIAAIGEAWSKPLKVLANQFRYLSKHSRGNLFMIYSEGTFVVFGRLRLKLIE